MFLANGINLGIIGDGSSFHSEDQNGSPKKYQEIKQEYL